MNFITAFARAAHGLNLTPQERAFLRLVEGVIWTALVAMVGVLSNLMSGGAFAINKQTVLVIAGAGAVAILATVKKLVSAQGDPLLTSAVDAGAAVIQAHLPSAASVAPVAAPGSVTVTSAPTPSPVTIAAPTAAQVANAINAAIAAQAANSAGK